MKYTLPELPYPYDAFEPYIDARTMELHYSKHHQTYVDKLNGILMDDPGILENYPEIENMAIEELVVWSAKLNDLIGIKSGIRDFGGGHANHSLFWNIMKKDGGGEPNGALREQMENDFKNELGSFTAFRTEFTKMAMQLFGSGWTWLVKDTNGKLHIINTVNQDSPLSQQMTPIVTLDVWEHAYYLKYQNRRKEYIDAWWNVVDWREAERRYGAVK